MRISSLNRNSKAKQRSLFKQTRQSTLEKQRKSTPCPKSVKNLLEGKQPDADGLVEEEIDMKTSTLCIYISLPVLFIFTLTAVGCAVYLELLAFSKDEEWNEIIEGTRRFELTPADPQFSGKLLTQVTQLFPFGGMKEEDVKQVKRHLTRKQVYENAVLGLCGIFLVLSISHFLLFLVWSAVRARFGATSVFYGLLGWMLLLSMVILLLSCFAGINRGYLMVRVFLEDGEWPEEKRHHRNKYKHEGHHAVAEGCDVNARFPEEFQEPFLNFLKVIKICAYRFSKMNLRDVCRDKDKVTEMVLGGKTYTIKELEELFICPMDGHKVYAIVLLFMASVLCWIIMWVASFAEMTLNVTRNSPSVPQHKPSCVAAIDDIASRKESEMPPEMRIEMPYYYGTPSLTPQASQEQTPSCLSVVPHALDLNADSDPMMSRKYASNPRNPVGGIMHIVPSMVIHPPAPSTQSADHPGHHDKAVGSSWFEHA